MVHDIIMLFLKASAIYFISINVIYGTLLMLSWLKIKKYKREIHKSSKDLTLPGVSFVIPAFNEQSLIVETLQTYLSLTQTKKEIIVINDGSSDNTFKLLQTMFQLRRSEESPLVFSSITHPGLRVVEASHLGKAQALNLGIEYANFDIICTMDADTVPTSRGVEGCLRAFAHDKQLMAAGGIIQVLHSSVLKDNSPIKQNTIGWINHFQRIEYLRTFLCERLGWSLIGSTLLISGAFCMVRKEALRKIGGFRKDSITEDLDLIVRLRRAYKGEKFHFKLLPITTCHTQVPMDLKHLMVQRIRWQMGLVETLRNNLGMFFDPALGTLGFFAIPYFWLVEIFSPAIETLGMILLPFAIYQGWINLEMVGIFFFVGVLFHLMVTLIGIHLDNRYVSKGKQWSFIKTFFDTLLVHFGYKQLLTLWRLFANLKSFKKKHHWGEKPRQEIIHQAP